ncbi:MAG: hypothetical protein AAFO97_05600 [Pseudomonadota bacterium]
MIDVKVSGKKATVTRSYDFPQIEPVDSFPLKVEYGFEIPMAGLDPKSPSAKRILSKFAKTYKDAVNKQEKSRNAENDKIWELAAKEIKTGKDPRKVEKDTQIRLQKRWGEFHDKVLDPAIYDVVCDLADEDLNKNKIPRAKASSFKDYFSGITLGGPFGRGQGGSGDGGRGHCDSRLAACTGHGWCGRGVAGGGAQSVRRHLPRHDHHLQESGQGAGCRPRHRVGSRIPA